MNTICGERKNSHLGFGGSPDPNKQMIFDFYNREIIIKYEEEMKMKIPFSPPDITEEEINEVAAALRSGWITTGPKTKLLEKKAIQ